MHIVSKIEDVAAGREADMRPEDMAEALKGFLMVARDIRSMYDDFFRSPDGLCMSADQVNLSDKQVRSLLIRFACLHHFVTDVELSTETLSN